MANYFSVFVFLVYRSSREAEEKRPIRYTHFNENGMFTFKCIEGDPLNSKSTQMNKKYNNSSQK